MANIIITNNEKVKTEYENNPAYEVDFVNQPFLDILYKVRDKIHKGSKLLTHPLSGSVKPGETPFKSIAITNEKGNLDIDSLMLIEKSISLSKKLIDHDPIFKSYSYTDEVLDDFRDIDFTLITNALSK